MKKSILPLLLSALGLATASHAEVLDAAANGFTTVNEVHVEAAPAETWQAAVAGVGRWWSPLHTISGDAGRLSIDPVVHGCFCETLGSDAGVVHLTVTMVNPNVLLRMTGGLGPLGLMGVDGNMTLEFDAVDGGTRVRLTYAVGGYRAGGLDAIAAAVDGVLGEALARLEAYIETGDPEAADLD